MLLMYFGYSDHAFEYIFELMRENRKDSYIGHGKNNVLHVYDVNKKLHLL